MMETDALLAGDPAAWERLVREHNPLLKGLAQRNFSKYGFAADTATCEDICSTIWQQLLADERSLLRRCLEEGRFLPTLHALARNRCIDHLRKFGRFQSSDAEPVAEETAATRGHAPGLEREWLLGHIRALPERERAVIELFYLQELSYQEIHQASGIPENSIGPTLQRALKHLRQRIESEESHAL
jgi:RNA polymerase sigma-70 factor (ECF subfamily)